MPLDCLHAWSRHDFASAGILIGPGQNVIRDLVEDASVLRQPPPVATRIAVCVSDYNREGGRGRVLTYFIFLLILLMLAAAGVYAIFARDLSGARSRLAGRSQTIDTSFGRMEYAMIGEGDPTLIIHGAGGGFDQAIDIARALAGRGYRLIAPSRFGYLGSPLPPELDTTMQADAYAELLDRLEVGSAYVIAISAGWSAMKFAIRHPQRCRALVLLVPADYLPPRMPNHGGALFRAIIASDFVAWAALKVMWLVPARWPERCSARTPSSSAPPSRTKGRRYERCSITSCQ